VSNKGIRLVILKIMIALTIVIIVEVYVTLPTAAPAITSALAFHTEMQSENISQAARTAQDVDKHLNDTRQAIQNGNTRGALFYLGQAQQQLSLLKSGNVTTTPPIINPLETDLFLGTSPGSQQQPTPSIAPQPPPSQTSPPPLPPELEQPAVITLYPHDSPSGINKAKRNNTGQTDAIILIEIPFSTGVYIHI
jgi:hypothetical protein